MNNLIDMNSFVNCCNHCGTPENIKNYPALLSLTDIQYNNLNLILPHIKHVLCDNLDTHKHIELINEIKIVTNKSIQDTILDINHKKDIEKRSKELSTKKYSELTQELEKINTDNIELQRKITKKDRENKTHIDNNE